MYIYSIERRKSTHTWTCTQFKALVSRVNCYITCIRVLFSCFFTSSPTSGTARLPPRLLLLFLIITVIVWLSDNCKTANYRVYLGILIICKLSPSYLLFSFALYDAIILISLSASYMWNHIVLCMPVWLAYFTFHGAANVSFLPFKVSIIFLCI